MLYLRLWIFLKSEKKFNFGPSLDGQIPYFRAFNFVWSLPLSLKLGNVLQRLPDRPGLTKVMFRSNSWRIYNIFPTCFSALPLPLQFSTSSSVSIIEFGHRKIAFNHMFIANPSNMLGSIASLTAFFLCNIAVYGPPGAIDFFNVLIEGLKEYFTFFPNPGQRTPPLYGCP